ncbi:hypothetical protein HPB51_004209 [Rhipicephalus microplus]|uniref:DUF7041 domain-containing protein n=1 Tax=Rhipicephalus microplus TaxID=6941 RepID=A0A9J6DZI7_RHIMP|nr:hypothetical protein HPB51_004209 [Rhipicephalus microplus]
MDLAGSTTNPTSPDTQKDARPSGAAVAATQHVNLPPFWPNSPSTWFLQVETHFRLRQITSQQTRYWNLVSCLPPDVADDLAYILASPHPSHPYDTLKAAIISRKSESEHNTPTAHHRLQSSVTVAHHSSCDACASSLAAPPPLKRRSSYVSCSSSAYHRAWSRSS